MSATLKRGWSEEKIAAALRQAEPGRPSRILVVAGEVARECTASGEVGPAKCKLGLLNHSKEDMMENRRNLSRSASKLACVGVWLLCGLANAAGNDAAVSIGTLRTVSSEVLHEQRTVSIRLPAEYEETRLTYPVVYLLYGDQTEGYFAETVSALNRLEEGAEIPAFILVGIHNTDRYGDLLPVHFAGRPSGADAFMRFLAEELFPFVETDYRTKPYRVLIGPQAGGPFGLYLLARRPGLVNAFVLENPFSAPASRETLAAGMRDLAAERSDVTASVFINSFDRAGFQDHSEATSILVDFLEAIEPTRPRGLEIRRRHLQEPTFVPQLELIQPFRTFFTGFYPPDASAMSGLSDIVTYYQGISGRLGFDVDPPSFLLTIASEGLIRSGGTETAREILQYATQLRQNDVNALFRIANLDFADGELHRAEASFRTLLEIHPDPMFAERLKSIRRMLASSAAHALSEALKEGLPPAEATLLAIEARADEEIYFDERELTALGYRLLRQQRVDAAIFILELNARRFPDSWNAHDSLGEGYTAAGRIADASRSYRESLRLNPGNDNARTVLEKLEARQP